MVFKKYILVLLFLWTQINFLCSQNSKSQNNPINLSSFVNLFMGSQNSSKYTTKICAPFGAIEVGLKSSLLDYETPPLPEDSNLVFGIENIIKETPFNQLTHVIFQPLNANHVYDQNSYNNIKYRSSNLSANPGFLQADFNNDIHIQLTSTEQIACHKYDYLKADNNQLIINFDPNQTDLINTTLYKLTANTIQGFSFDKNYPDIKIYFHVVFSKNILKQDVLNNLKDINKNVIIGNNFKVKFTFKSIATLEVKIAYSSISLEDAQQKTENCSQNFALIQKNTARAWENELQKIKINTTNNNLKSIFYTCFYRSLISPNISISNNFNNKMVTSNGLDSFTKYSSIYPNDLFLNKFSFIGFLNDKRADYVAQSLFENIQNNGSENPDLFLQSIPIFCETILKNHNPEFNENLIEYVLKPPFLLSKNFQLYRKFGYIPVDSHSLQTVSTTLFYNYIDWCMAQMALSKNNKDSYLFFLKKSLQYNKLFDLNSKIFKPKTSSGNFLDSFNQIDYDSHAYKTGNAWNNNFFVLHDLNGYISLYQNKNNLNNKLDSLFTFNNIKKVTIVNKNAKAKLPKLKDTNSKISINNTIPLKSKFSESYKLGQFDFNNSYDWHTFYLFTIIGTMDKTAYFLKNVMDSFISIPYKNLSIFNEQKQLNTWFIWTCLGLYPLNPSDGNYIFGYPFIDQALITLPNKRQLKIEVNRLNTNPNNSKISSVYFNGEKLRFNFINYKDILKGGTLKFELN